ncbi:hypothetical protein [Ornithinimicrobium murale]|uniref:hypothetical protein n=1 Tax=Ornithinimicrobium murale TaxID=1050153 RepID=UPI000E0D752F|nr:hypothetical protein [Ornithinimicrobium murale]
MKITCTYCGSEVSAFWDDSGLAWDAKVTIECESTSCGAIWDASGDVTRTPQEYQDEVDKLAESYRARH